MKDTLIAIIFGIVGALILVEWMVGCGETYTDSPTNLRFRTLTDITNLISCRI